MQAADAPVLGQAIRGMGDLPLATEVDVHRDAVVTQGSYVSATEPVGIARAHEAVVERLTIRRGIAAQFTHVITRGHVQDATLSEGGARPHGIIAGKLGVLLAKEVPQPGQHRSPFPSACAIGL